MQNKIKYSRGMTLIEILIVVSLISVTSLALYHALANGLRVWTYSTRLMTEEDIVLFIEKLSMDVRNSIYYSKIPFEGESQMFTFPTMVALRDSSFGTSTPKVSEQLGRVQYRYDVSKKAIVRRQADYGQALNNEYDPERILVSNVDSLRFQYIYVTEKEQIVSENILETAPSALQVEVVFFDQKEKRSFTRVIDVPLGG